MRRDGDAYARSSLILLSGSPISAMKRPLRLRNYRRSPNPNDIIVGDLVLLAYVRREHGAAQAGEIGAALRAFQVEDILGDEPAIEAAQRYRALPASGQTPRKTVDVIVVRCASGASISSCTKIAISK